MVEHGPDLLESDTRKPIDELRRDRPIFEILEEGRYRHARTAEYPGAAHAVGIPFDGRASGPIDHRENGTTAASRRLTTQANRLRADGAQAPPASSPVERVVRR